MKRIASLLLSLACAGTWLAAQASEPGASARAGEYFDGRRVLVAYFSWSGNTQRVAQEIGRITGGDLFRIEPVTPYPTDYTECTEVALAERDSDARPAIRETVADFDDYDVVFLGCPVWWHTAPMIIATFAESYDFEGKTVVPFCTYASTYRDETLQRIADLTPVASHLTGFGSTGPVSGVQSWIDLINEEWNEQNAGGSGSVGGGVAEPSVDGPAPMEGTVNLWRAGDIPAVTQGASNSDGPDFIPNMEVFTVDESVAPKGAVIICPGGAFVFRSVQAEGYDVAHMLVPMGYQCFVVNYRIVPYTMQESALDLQRAIRYVRAHAADYRIDPADIALVGFSAGGILNGEVLLNWRGLANASSLVPSYQPDELDNVPVEACAVGMIYAFYGRLSVSMNDVETLRAADLPPAFYCWGSNDGFAGQFRQNSDAVRQAGCETEVYILQGYPHGYGTGGSPSVWGNDFDAFLTRVMSGNASGIAAPALPTDDEGTTVVYDTSGRIVDDLSTAPSGVYILRSATGSRKILK